jgi:hypothetical protein
MASDTTVPDPNQPDVQPDNNQIADQIADLLQSLRRKEGTWVEWGQACQQLQKAGYSPQRIFEETGFEPAQQNQITVAAQVYASMLSAGVVDSVRSHFEHRGSDTLYEFRILTQSERAAAATLTLAKGIDSEGAHELAKAIKEFSRFSSPPEGFAPFSEHPGDAIAYYYCRLARQQADLQMRSRLIGLGLKFAETESARQQLESLLLDVAATQKRPAPCLPLYRIDSEEQLPRILPVAGRLPLAAADFKAVPIVEEEGPFRLVKFSGTGAWIPVPGWQVVLVAEDPVVILVSNDQFPKSLPGKPEENLVIVDRAQRQWRPDTYFVVEQEGQLQLQWFEDAPSIALLGQVILVLRPKKILDEDYTKDPWQVEE